ncbi:MAG: glutamate ABC transporter substrate-binding protein [Actinomycetota bacterium]|nr:glutamate ABC transporter substrate-binding protein [Actinomycetota bacterium]
MNHRRIALVVAAVLLAGACSGGERLPAAVAAPATTEPAEAPGIPECTTAEAAAIDPLASYDPLAQLPDPGEMPGGSSMADIVESGRLRVGVSPADLLFGSRNLAYDPDGTNDDELAFEGFDVEMLKQVAFALFGPDADLRDVIEFVAIPYSQRLPKLITGEVDLVAHTMTINCKRWRQIAFSAEYFHAGQRILVAKGSPYASIQELNAAGATVCVPAGSTNLDELNRSYLDVVQDVQPDISDCLVRMQQGKVDAITGDDTVLAGLAAQDPTTVVVGEQFTAEPYGLGVNAERVDLVRFVNRVLADMLADGRWEASYRKWLVPALTPDVDQNFQPLYGRPEP